MFETLLSFLLASSLSIANTTANLDKQSNFDETTLLSVSQFPVQQEEYLAPAYMSAPSILAIDLDSQTTLFEKNSTLRLPIASLTKLMTAYIILDENNPDEVVTVSANAAGTTGSTMGLYAGEEITVRNLLFGLLIKSGNDAAVALAEHNSESSSAFIKKMNLRAKQLGMVNTHFANVMGLDSTDAYASARDLALLSSYLAHNPDIKSIVSQSTAEVTSTSGYAHKLVNTNILLGQLGIKGLKTGKTPLAGECLISLAESPEGHEILTIVLASENRFADTKILIDWIYKAYTW